MFSLWKGLRIIAASSAQNKVNWRLTRAVAQGVKRSRRMVARPALPRETTPPLAEKRFTRRCGVLASGCCRLSLDQVAF